MKVYDTSGTLYNWTPKSNPRFKPSSYHTAALQLVKALYSLDQILEEVSVPGEHIFLDIYIPVRKLVIEVQGEQHYEFNPFFHKNKADFKFAQNRDRRKAEWCKINNIDLVTLDCKDDESEWKRQIIER